MATLSVGGTTVFDGATLQSGVTFPAGHIIKIHSFHDGTQTAIASNTTGVEIISHDFTPVKSNSAYYFSCSIAAARDAASGTSDKGDCGITAWLQDSGAGDKYRFGYVKSSNTRHGNLTSANSNYIVYDSDGGPGDWSSGWNQDIFSFSWVPGNQSNYNNSTVVSSSLTAGETVTLKVWLAGNSSARNYNYSHDSGTGSAGFSHYSIAEVAT